MEIYIQRADYGPATVLGRRVLAADPCNEQVHQRLMVCYSVTGHRHLAMTQYHRLVSTLWEALRVRPSAQTTSLYEALRRPAQLPA
jgi:DNA-binding SARP family transcriptional activator